MDTKHCAVDGWVDAIPVPGPRGTVSFDLVVRPADIDALDDDAPDTVVTCTSGDPRLTVDALEVLDTALVPVLREMALDRYGDYVVIFDADRDQVPVSTAHGTWVGLADNPVAIATLIDIHERVNGGDA